MDKQSKIIMLTGPIFGMAYFTARKYFIAKPEPEQASAPTPAPEKK
jgi:hypothetical protein